MQWSVTVYTTCPQAVFKSRVSHLCIYTRHWNTVISSNRKLILVWTYFIVYLQINCKKKKPKAFQIDPTIPTNADMKKFRHFTFYTVSFSFLLRNNSFQSSDTNAWLRYDLIWIVKKYIVHFITHDVITKIIIGTIIDNSSNGRKNQTS